MMSRGQWKEFFVEIRKSLSRYLSILFMVALGTAFFAGLRSSEPDMRNTLDKYLDDVGFMNARVIGTMGMTENDVTAIAAIRGVTDAEGLYTADVLCEMAGRDRGLHFMSITGEINRLTVDEGRLPENADECFLDNAVASAYGLKIGDTITVEAGDDEEISDTLACDTFTIVGIGISPEYLTFSRGTSRVGDGSIAGFVYVIPEAFTLECYTQVYLRIEALDGYNCFSDEYDEKLTEIMDRIEAIADERCEIRYLEVTEDARQQLADARVDLAEGREEAEKELADAWEQIEDGKKELEDGKEEIRENEETLLDGKNEIADGKVTLADSLAQIEDGERQIAEAREQIAEKQQEIADARNQINIGYAAYNDGLAQLEEGKAQLDTYQQQLDTLLTVAEAAEGAYGEVLNRVEEERALIDAEEAQLNADKQAIEDAGGNWHLDTEILQREADLNSRRAALAYYETQLEQAKNYYDELMTNVDELQGQIDDGWAQYNSGLIALEDGLRAIKDAENQVNAGNYQLEQAIAELDEKAAELADARRQWENGKKELEDAEAEIADGEEKLKEGKDTLAEGEQTLSDAEKEYADAKAEVDQKLADAEAEIADGQAKLDEVEVPEWYVLNRNTVEEYVEYDQDGQKIGKLAQVFPLLFFFVAALVSLTTMTRMVEEQRTQIGTLKALGYSDASIAAKYILYALSATLIGSVLGVIVGSKGLPWVVITAYGIMYQNLPEMVTPLHAGYCFMAAGMAIVSTVGATIVACARALAERPASLMRPTAPPKGKRILFERIPFLWKHLNFSIKATLRNLFRYKKRLFMTVFGIGACMGLLVVGYGLQDSISAIVNHQYSTVWLYDLSINLKSDAEDEEVEQLNAVMDAQSLVAAYTDVRTESMDASANGASKSIYLTVFDDQEASLPFVVLKNRVTDAYSTLDENTIIICEKLAKNLNVEVGDTITLTVDDTKDYTVTVGGIVENYIYYYTYMSVDTYRSVFGEEPEKNQRLVVYREKTPEESERQNLTVDILAETAALSITETLTLQKTVDRMMLALNYVVLLLIGCAGLLAFIVLYNLNNINITERKRELATIKLLGFFPGELAMYVFRENVLLTLMGVVLGRFLGQWLTMYVIETVEIDMIMFGREILPRSYLLSAGVTLIFALIVNVVMYFRLQKIDMIESLKSVE